MDFIRSGGVCKISTNLAKIYNNYELYKVWWPLYDIDLILFVLRIQWAFTFTQTESELRNHKQSGARLTLAECYLQLEKLGEVDFEQLFATRE